MAPFIDDLIELGEKIEKLKEKGKEKKEKAANEIEFILLKKLADFEGKSKHEDNLLAAAYNYQEAMEIAAEELKNENKFLEAYKNFKRNCSSHWKFSDIDSTAKSMFKSAFDKNLENYL